MSVDPGLQHQHVQSTKLSAENTKTDQAVIVQQMSVLPLDQSKCVRVLLLHVYVQSNIVKNIDGLLGQEGD